MKKYYPVILFLILSVVAFSISGCDSTSSTGKLEHSIFVNIEPENAGTVEVIIPVQTKDVGHGQTVIVTAKSNTGYSFSHWEDDLSGEENPKTMLVNEEKTITAVFVPSISGQVTGSASVKGLPGVVIEYPGGEVVTDANGFFAIKGIDLSGPVTLTPVAPAGALGFQVAPSKREVNWPEDSVKFSASWIEFVLEWGEDGIQDGQFWPAAVEVDNNGNVYVGDIDSNRIQKFSSEGSFLSKWGSYGAGNSQFNNPYGIAADGNGNIFVADFSNNRIQKFTSAGVYITQWGSLGSGDGKFNDPFDVAVDSQGNVYVADSYNHRVQKFTNNGVFLSKWGVQGSGNLEFELPNRLTIDPDDDIFVSDFGNDRVQKISSGGDFLFEFGQTGSGEGQLERPYGVGIDSYGRLYVPDRLNHRVQIFSSGGHYLGQWGTFGSEPGQFSQPLDIALDKHDNIYIVDVFNYRIQKFKPVH